MKLDLNQLSPQALWKRQSVRVGAALTLIGGATGVIANMSAVVGIFTADKTTALVENTRATVAGADAKIDEILKLMRINAALAGAEFDPRAEGMIEMALEAILTSGDARKDEARQALETGNLAGAAAVITEVAEEQAKAAGGAAAAAAESWREAAALYAPTDPAAAIDAYKRADALDPGDLNADTALAGLYLATGDLEAAESLSEAVLARAAAQSADAGWARLTIGSVADARGERGRAEGEFSAVLSLAKKIDDAQLGAVAANSLAAVYRRRGRIDEAEQLLQFSLAQARRAGNRSYEARALSSLGLIAFNKGDPAGAVERLKQADAVYESLGDLRRQTVTIGNLGGIAIEQGDLESAERHLLRSVEIGERLGLKQSIAEDFNNLADLALRRGRLADAEQYVARAFVIIDETGLAALKPYIQTTAGQLALAREKHDEACSLWAQASAGFASLQDKTEAVVAELAAEAGCGLAAL